MSNIRSAFGRGRGTNSNRQGGYREKFWSEMFHRVSLMKLSAIGDGESTTDPLNRAGKPWTETKPDIDEHGQIIPVSAVRFNSSHPVTENNNVSVSPPRDEDQVDGDVTNQRSINPLHEISEKPRMKRSVLTEASARASEYAASYAPNINDEALELSWIDMRAFANGRQHNTSEYDMLHTKDTPPTLVDSVVFIIDNIIFISATLFFFWIRRGAEFTIQMSMFRPVDTTKDAIKLVFETGSLPAASKGTRVSLDVLEGASAAGWTVDRVRISGWRVKISLSSAPFCVIGKWKLKIVTEIKYSIRSLIDKFVTELTERETPAPEFYILFNAWSPEDPVYMESKSDRDEYVLNDVGKIWRGSHNSIRPCYWAFAQFDSDVLDACLHLLERSRLRSAAWGDPVQVARCVVQMVNAPDDDGVLVGNWSEDFSLGTAPTEWTGSATILRDYLKFGLPVKFGQCWVFAGVTCTVLRSLGIPSRVVTNYSSAHDTDTSCSVDVHMEAESGKLMDDLNADSVWNFHVWNDCWMRRADLGTSRDGWQAVDATPQEKSNGLYRAGPAPLSAIFEGDVSVSFDAPFIFAEVNADKCYWLVKRDGQMDLNHVETDEIGRQVVTKRPGRDLALGNSDVEDITNEYKQNEGTAQERDVMRNALLTGRNRLLESYRNAGEHPNDVKCSLDLKSKAKLGEPLFGTLRLVNDCDKEHFCKCTIRVNSVSYTGELGAKVKTLLHDVQLSPKQSETINIEIKAADYTYKLNSACAFMFTVMVKVDEHETHAITDDVRLKMPDILIELVDEAKLDEPCRARVSLLNPLPISLSDCRFILEGPGLMSSSTFKCRDVAGGGMALQQFAFRPWKKGQRTLVAHFESDHLNDVDGSITLDVTD